MAAQTDSFGRRINYLRISVTDLCNLRCRYCMPEQGIKKKGHKEILSFEEIEAVVRAAVKLGINKIRFTGGEPLVRKGIIELISGISKFPGLRDISITTNGVLLKKYAADLRKAGVTRVNISIDSLDEEKYRSITRGGNLQDVLAGIAAAKEEKLLPIKLNVVLIGGFNDDEIDRFVSLTERENLEVRFIELMPIGQAADWNQSHFISNRVVLEKVPKLVSLPFKGHGGIARYYKLPNGKGTIGLINPLSRHFCDYCNRIRLTADGKLKPCLHSDYELDIRDYSSYEKLILDGIKAKPRKHGIIDADYVPVVRNMNEIGG